MTKYRSVRKPGGGKGPPREKHPPTGGGGPAPLPEPEPLSGGFEGTPGGSVPRFEAPRGENYTLREVEDSEPSRGMAQGQRGSNGD
jgi:hypothetical protein